MPVVAAIVAAQVLAFDLVMPSPRLLGVARFELVFGSGILEHGSGQLSPAMLGFPGGFLHVSTRACS